MKNLHQNLNHEYSFRRSIEKKEMTTVMKHYEQKYNQSTSNVQTEVSRLRLIIDKLSSKVEMTEMKENRSTHSLIDDLFER